MEIELKIAGKKKKYDLDEKDALLILTLDKIANILKRGD